MIVFVSDNRKPNAVHFERRLLFELETLFWTSNLIIIFSWGMSGTKLLQLCALNTAREFLTYL